MGNPRWYQIWLIAKANGLFLDARGMRDKAAFNAAYSTQCELVESTMQPVNAKPDVWDDWCQWHAEQRLYSFIYAVDLRHLE